MLPSVFHAQFSKKNFTAIGDTKLLPLKKAIRERNDFVNIHFTETKRKFFYVSIGCNRRNVPNFRRVFLMLNYTEKNQNTYIQS
jgi:hypothetical protein